MKNNVNPFVHLVQYTGDDVSRHFTTDIGGRVGKGKVLRGGRNGGILDNRSLTQELQCPVYWTNFIT